MSIHLIMFIFYLLISFLSLCSDKSNFMSEEQGPTTQFVILGDRTGLHEDGVYPIVLAKSLETNPEISNAMLAFANDKNDREAVRVLRAYPHYAGMAGTTCVATMLEGGHAYNALPQSAKVSINCRIFPGVGTDATMAQLKKAISNEALEWKTEDPGEEADSSPLNEGVLSAVERAVHNDYPDVPEIGRAHV